VTAVATRTLPDHGTTARYHRDCRNPECLELGRRYGKQGRVRRAQGTPGLVDVGPVADHITWLLADRDTTRTSIAAAAGVSVATIVYIHARQRPGIRRRTAAAILAVREPQPVDIVDGPGTARRLRALIAIGYSNAFLAESTGRAVSHISDICHGRRTAVRRATAERVQDLYHRLAATPGPSESARALASRRGWAPPAAWDDIGDPDAWPDFTGRCGTAGGATLHYRHGLLPVCGPCRNARADARERAAATAATHST
jgi:hypothetical protein